MSITNTNNKDYEVDAGGLNRVIINKNINDNIDGLGRVEKICYFF